MKALTILMMTILLVSCSDKKVQNTTKTMQVNLTAQDILGNKKYRAISYGGYRQLSREQQPTVAQLKEDMRLLHAIGIRIIRTYNVQYDHASNVLKAIAELKREDEQFKMYVMLGAWIDCAGAWTTPNPNHDAEEAERNAAEIARAAALANAYPDIVKIIAVGNEAMVKWAASYYVQPGVILKYVEHLQQLKADNKLPKTLWVTSSDNFASWGGGTSDYHVEDLNKLIKAVDYISVHTYPMHDTHYNPEFWGVEPNEEALSKEAKIQAAMKRSLVYAQEQYRRTVAYMKSLGVDKPVHIGETGWASASNGFYGPTGSKACDEYKEGVYHRMIRDWTDSEGISCFYFEGFDEIWKDAPNPGGSENHFGLFTIDGQAKYAIWDAVDAGHFKGLGRNGKAVTKTYGGDETKLLEEITVPAARAVQAPAH